MQFLIPYFTVFHFFPLRSFSSTTSTASLPLAETVRTPEEIQASRKVVLSDLLESERAHVAEIRGLLENFLEPLQSSQM